ncbi:NUDIX domain-containing protein [Nocardioides sp. GY 10127]|nr:NUDIX domain-containing protein [Nocardioides sp. GY 10127]
MVGTHQLWLPAVTAVVVHEGQVLLTLRADNGRWAPITGIVDPGEEPAVAARREALEEASVEVSVDRLASVSVSDEVTHGNGDRGVYLDLTFACTWLGGEAAVGDDENLEVRWWPLDALPPMAAEMERRIADVLAGETATRFVR